MSIIATFTIPKCSDPHSPRPRLKHEPRPHYRPFMFSDKDLLNIDTIQRLMIREHGKPKQAVSMAAAVREAIAHHAAHLQRKAVASSIQEEPYDYQIRPTSH